jgi:hypothetical protein
MLERPLGDNISSDSKSLVDDISGMTQNGGVTARTGIWRSAGQLGFIQIQDLDV